MSFRRRRALAIVSALAVAGVLAPVWWGRDVLPRVVQASAATTFPVCGPAQWVLSGGAPIGSLVDGSVVQTLVLDGSTLAVTGACPAVAAKVSGTRHGTVVKAKWPQGGCGGVSGAARIGATIEPTCTTLTGRFSAHGLRQTLAATRSPCDVGLLDTGGTPRCAVPSVAIGSAEATTTLDDNGCLLSDLTLTSTTGVSALLSQGSCLHTRGKALRSPVDLTLDDAGGTPSGAGVTGIVRLLARPKSGAAPIGVDVEPPATLTLPLGDLSLAGNWYTNAFLDADGFATTLVGASPVLLDAVPIVAAGPEQIRLEVSGPLGLSFESTAAPALAGTRAYPRAAGPSTVSFVIPTDPALPDPRVESWQLINPDTAQVIVVGFQTGGFGVGETDARVREGHTFTASLLETAGQRRVEVTSDFSNRFHLDLTLVDGTNANRSTVDGDATGGCANESCLTDAYVGAVRVEARAKNLTEVFAVRDTIAAHLPAGARIVLHAVSPVGSAKQAIMSIFGLDASIRSIAPQLPASWAVSTGDRTLTIDTHPPNLLGDWQGTREFTSDFGPPKTCLPSEPLCAHLTVTAEPNGLRVAYCDNLGGQCTGSAAAAPCSLLFEGAVTPSGFVGVGFDNNPPCCVGCVGQNRVYGCTMTATITSDRHGQQTLEASFTGSVTSCPPDPASNAITHLKLCRPKPCAVP